MASIINYFSPEKKDLYQRATEALDIFVKAQTDLKTINEEIGQEVQIREAQIQQLINENEQFKVLHDRNAKVIKNINKITE